MFPVVTPPIMSSTYICNYSIWHWSNFGKCNFLSHLKMRGMDPSLLPSAIAELQTALHVSGGNSTHHQEHIEL